MTYQNSADKGLPPHFKKQLWIILSMGFVMLVLFFALVVAIIYKYGTHTRASTKLNDISLNLPTGTEVRHSAIEGERLLIQTQNAVIVINMASGQIVLRVKTTP